MNSCGFSPDRLHRYYLVHEWDELFERSPLVCWIGLNPSTADESDLDPTLRRIRGFSTREGYNRFCMLNLFAFRSTDPRGMLAHQDPVGPENDRWILHWASQAKVVVAAWGNHGGHLGRSAAVLALLRAAGVNPVSLGQNQNGEPEHPLYVSSERPLAPLAR